MQKQICSEWLNYQAYVHVQKCLEKGKLLKNYAASDKAAAAMQRMIIYIAALMQKGRNWLYREKGRNEIYRAKEA